jgi:hypothetical protein
MAQRKKEKEKDTMELQMKTILVTSFDIMGNAHPEFISQGQPTNQLHLLRRNIDDACNYGPADRALSSIF